MCCLVGLHPELSTHRTGPTVKNAPYFPSLSTDKLFKDFSIWSVFKNDIFKIPYSGGITGIHCVSLSQLSSFAGIVLSRIKHIRLYTPSKATSEQWNCVTTVTALYNKEEIYQGR